MKKAFTILLVITAAATYAQPKIITQAMITTKTTIVAPERDEQPAGSFTTESGEQVRIMRFGGDGETKTTTWLKNDLIKTLSESEMAVSTTIRDNAKKLTTTIMEVMGRKSGFYSTDEDQAEMRKRMDSMMSTRSQNGNFSIDRSPAAYSITYLDDAKKISGYNCKKAFVIGTMSSGKTDTTAVWYCPDFKMQGLVNTGGNAGGGFGGFTQSAGLSGMEELAGFPMQYERNMRNGAKMTVLVTKLVIDKEVADKEFEIAKDIEIKPLKDMQNGAGPGFQLRVAGQ